MQYSTKPFFAYSSLILLTVLISVELPMQVCATPLARAVLFVVLLSTAMDNPKQNETASATAHRRTENPSEPSPNLAISSPDYLTSLTRSDYDFIRSFEVVKKDQVPRLLALKPPGRLAPFHDAHFIAYYCKKHSILACGKCFDLAQKDYQNANRPEQTPTSRIPALLTSLTEAKSKPVEVPCEKPACPAPELTYTTETGRNWTGQRSLNADHAKQLEHHSKLHVAHTNDIVRVHDRIDELKKTTIESLLERVEKLEAALKEHRLFPVTQAAPVRQKKNFRSYSGRIRRTIRTQRHRLEFERFCSLLEHSLPQKCPRADEIVRVFVRPPYRPRIVYTKPTPHLAISTTAPRVRCYSQSVSWAWDSTVYDSQGALTTPPLKPREQRKLLKRIVNLVRGARKTPARTQGLNDLIGPVDVNITGFEHFTTKINQVLGNVSDITTTICNFLAPLKISSAVQITLITSTLLMLISLIRKRDWLLVPAIIANIITMMQLDEGPAAYLRSTLMTMFNSLKQAPQSEEVFQDCLPETQAAMDWLPLVVSMTGVGLLKSIPTQLEIQSVTRSLQLVAPDRKSVV